MGTMLKEQTVLVAMSGGVDSSVAAYLMKEQGYNVIGVTMKLYDYVNEDSTSNRQGCCSIDDIEDARRVCNMLNIPHYVFNIQKEFKDNVINYFTSEYQNGKTPHPCIECNDKIKFSFLRKRAQILGAKFIVTGHYARIIKKKGQFYLHKALSKNKDQTYALYKMTQEQLSTTLMPVGCYEKDEIRNLANHLAFPNAAKPDSQDICFIPSGNYHDFISKYKLKNQGNIVDIKTGKILGKHNGIEYFTIGQRKGLGIESNKPKYVIKINPKTKEILIGNKTDLQSTIIWANNVNYISGTPPQSNKVTVKTRYTSNEIKGSLFFYDNGNIKVELDTTGTSITPGQAIVFYQGDQLIGGAQIIENPINPQYNFPSNIQKEFLFNGKTTTTINSSLSNIRN